jgi:adenylylsulfate kinase
VKQQYVDTRITWWLTGQPGAGKTTLANELAKRLRQQHLPVCVLDGDEIRKGLSADRGFGPVARKQNIRRVAEMARLLNDAGVYAIAVLMSPPREDRFMARTITGPGRFVDVHVPNPPRVCEQRDPRGKHGAARRGAIADFTGVSVSYEVPESPDLAIDTAITDLATAVDRLMGCRLRNKPKLHLA